MAEQHRVYLALGSNLGDRRHNLEAALQALPPEVTVTAVSQLYETAPAYVLDQPAFLNLVVEAETALSPTELLAHLQRIEKGLGRERTLRYGPRLIDLDILFYEAQVLDLPGLTIPHPRLHERSFVLRPLADIARDFIHPILKRPIRALLAALPPDEGILRVLA
jgi:2-amino-4-hydroxy-6-hydroxymethyldihydropteridine diphosphokinase